MGARWRSCQGLLEDIPQFFREFGGPERAGTFPSFSLSCPGGNAGVLRPIETSDCKTVNRRVFRGFSRCQLDYLGDVLDEKHLTLQHGILIKPVEVSQTATAEPVKRSER